MQRWLKRNTLFFTFALSPLLFSSAQAGGEQLPSATTPTPNTSFTLKPFKAYYQAQFDLGISLSGEAVRQLKATDDGQWLISMNASAMMANINESSRFSFDQQQLRPQQYDYLRKVLGKKKRVQQRFDWADGTVVSTVKDSSTTLTLDQKTHDKVSYQIQLWHDLKAGLNEMHYTLADGSRLKELEFDRVGEETIDTPAGRFETIKVARDRGEGSARKTYIWFAKDLDHVIVKLEQIESDGKQYILLLERIENP
ncbi:MAG: DUF3108 domain-containing protein [Halopseudomonas sp.]